MFFLWGGKCTCTSSFPHFNVGIVGLPSICALPVVRILITFIDLDSYNTCYISSKLVRSKQISQLFIPEEAGCDTSFDAFGETRFHGMDSVNSVNMGLLQTLW